MKRLKDKVAIVSGAGSGIGREIALLFAGEEAIVSVADYVTEKGEETVRQIRQGGGEAIFIKADVSQASYAERIVKQTVEKYGRLDILCNNAWILGDVAPVGEASEENYS